MKKPGLSTRVLTAIEFLINDNVSVILYVVSDAVTCDV